MRKLIVIGVMLLLSGCASFDVPQLITGEEVSPPFGCVEARERGHDC